MLIEKHLKLMTTAHGCPPAISVYGKGMGLCSAHRWYTQKTDLFIPKLPLPMITMRFDGHQKIWALTNDLQLAKSFSLPGQLRIISANTKTNWKLIGQFDVVGLVFEHPEVNDRLEEISCQFKKRTDDDYYFHDPFLLNVVKQLVRFDQPEHNLREDFSNSLFKSLELYILTMLSIGEDDFVLELGAERLVNYTVTKLTANLAEKIHIEAIAQELGISHSYLSRIFKEKVGLTPHDFLLSRRLEHARHLLLSTNLSLEAIASESGFYSHSHLTRNFTDYMGLPPSKYRKHMMRKP